MSLDRRLFLLSAAALPLYAGPPVVFTAAEIALIEALTDCLVPADDAPGALAVGVAYYIDRQVAGPLNRFLPLYRAGLPRLKAACREKTGHEFSGLDFPARTRFLQSMENDPFFSVLADHTMQGYYGDPEHGGNRDGASWKMLGIKDMMRGHKH